MPMTASERRPLARGAVAGLMMLSALIICGTIGGVVGAIVGLFAPLLLLGIGLGFVAGIFSVRTRFPDL